jgi:DNA-binding NtrC family response regulator
MRSYAREFSPAVKSCTILVADDDEAMGNLLTEALQESGCKVIQFDNGHDVLAFLSRETVTVIVTDLRMPGGGFSYLERLQLAAPNCPVLLMTAYGDAHSKEKALACGMKGYFEKPVRIQELKEWICRTCGVKPCGNNPLTLIQ